MSDPLTQMFEGRDWLLADGATGTNLFNRGLASDVPPEFWCDSHPAEVRAVHDAAIGAGADLILTNSFGANAARLRLRGAAARTGDFARIAASIAREAAGAAGRPVIVAGSMGPTGEIMAPMGNLTPSSAVEIFHEAAEGLKSGGVDVLWAETFSAAEEFRAVAEAARLAGMPWCGTMSFDTAGRTMMGLAPGDLVALVAGLPHPPLAYGANCGVGASDLLRSLLGFAAQGSEARLIAKGNAGIPRYAGGHLHYDGTPELMARYATFARDCGATIIGGCCGTTAEHLDAMRRALEAHVPGPRPSLERIVAEVGPLTSAGHGSDGDAPLVPRRMTRGPRD